MVSILNEIEKEQGLIFSQIFKSITTDNGPEFADCTGMEQSILNPETRRTTVYKAHPYSAYERGTNENTNGIIRRFIPKGTDIGKLSDEFLNRVEKWINTLPRKILGYASAEKMYNKEIQNIMSCPAQAAPG
jgi:transposase, IS30 family